jgi:uncharacterized SAM-binding protein YcdF (DUF218 family)
VELDSLFFVASKLFAPLVEPGTWIVLGAAFICLALVRGRDRAVRIGAAATFAFVAIMSVFPVGELLLRPLEAQFPVNPPLARVDGIIILGGAEDALKSALWGQPQMNEAAERYTETLALARRFPNARILFTGGSGDLKDLGGVDQSEAAAAGRFFDEQGLDPARLVFERAARNTAENARLSLELVEPGPTETWVLVTSAFHLPRAVRSFKQAGWPNIVPFPVDFRSGGIADDIGWDLAGNLSLTKIALKEYLGLLVYRLTGR